MLALWIVLRIVLLLFLCVLPRDSVPLSISLALLILGVVTALGLGRDVAVYRYGRR